MNPLAGDRYRLVDGTVWRVLEVERDAERRPFGVSLLAVSSSIRKVWQIELPKLLAQVDGWSPGC